MARNAAAGPPSIARWSKVRQACIVGRTATAPSTSRPGGRGYGRSRGSPTCGGLRIAVVMSTRVDAAVRDGERAARRARPRVERALARTSGELGDPRVDLLEREPVGAAHDRARSGPRRSRRRRATLISSSSSISSLGDARVEPRMLAERGGHELHDDRRDADARRGARLVQPRAQLDERLHVELEHGGQLGGGLQARDHAAGDRAAPPAQRDRRARP